MSSDSIQESYGTGDATFRAAGGEDGIRRLVNSFYDIMSTNVAYARLFDMHPEHTIARDKLARFLCGWMGGPHRYNEKYGTISIPRAHSHLVVTEIERDQWLACMAEALAQQDYPETLVVYLLEQLAVPAEFVLRKSRKPE